MCVCVCVWLKSHLWCRGEVKGLSDGGDRSSLDCLSLSLCVCVCVGLLTARHTTCHLFASASNKIHSSNGAGSKQEHTHSHTHTHTHTHANMFMHAWGQCILAPFCNRHPSQQFSQNYAITAVVAINPGVRDREREREREKVSRERERESEQGETCNFQ